MIHDTPILRSCSAVPLRLGLLALAVAVLALASAPGLAQSKDKPGRTGGAVLPLPRPGSSAPGALQDPTLVEVQKALKDAAQELDAARALARQDAGNLGDEIAAAEKRVRDLREALSSQEARQRQVDAEIPELEAKIVTTTETHTRARDNLDVVRGEVESQRLGLKERFTGTLAAVEEPELLASNASDAPTDTVAQVEDLLGRFTSVLRLADSAGEVQVAVQLAAANGRIVPVDALRLGLFGGYYSYPESADAGFLLADGEGKASFRGESAGFSVAQRAAIARLVREPAAGGMLPSDVSGGAGVTAMQARDSLARWFELGGFFMWPLLVVFLVSVVLILERAVVLGWRSLGMQRQIDRVLSLVRRDQLEAAEAHCDRMRGAVGRVLHAALVHRRRERSVMEDAVQEALLHNAPSFLTRLSFISLCAAVSPLFGLLGTVTGMITTFKMVTLFGTSDPRFLAGGISEALITTEAGLWIAIPALLMRGVLGAVADAGLGRLEAGALSVVIALVKRQEESSVGVGEAA